jgi:methionine-rich copper-binding protein CopC
MRWTSVILLSLLCLATTDRAQAHAFLEQASPQVGSTVAKSPTELRLQFSEAIEPKFSSIELARKGDGIIDTGPAGLDPHDERALVVAIQAVLAPGAYKVTWRVVSRDTHVTSGDFTFEVGP